MILTYMKVEVVRLKSFLREIIFVVPAVILAGVALAGIGMNPLNLPDLSGIPGSAVTSAAKEEPGQQSDPGQSADPSAKDKAKIKKTNYKGSTQWKDGVYIGKGTGFGGTIQVEVTIKNGKMTRIDDVSHGQETPEYYEKAAAIIPKILKAQSPNVDTISGATYSSAGIREAVIHALNQAGAEIANPSGSNPASDSESGTGRKTSTGKKLADGKPADGTYTGSAICEKFDYRVTLSVRFQNGKAMALSNLKVTGNEDDANVAYYKKAWKPMVKKLLKAQTTKVDVVSGATYSSNAIVDAYQDAYNKAVSKNSKSKGKTKGKSSSGDSTTKTLPSDDTENIPAGTVQDGTYHVSAVCDPDEDKDFSSYTLYADVTFAGGKCTAITNFTSTDETNKSYYTKAANGTSKSAGVVEQILSKQSATGIAAVSGATCSSRTIRALYLQALTQATGVEQKAEDSDSSSGSPGTADSGTANPTAPDGAAGTQNGTENRSIKDGTYSVSATVVDLYEDFWDYKITADVIFQDGKLTGIENLSANTDSTNISYCNRAANGTVKKPGIIAQLIANQSSSAVDMVSGATCSSLAMLELYESALALAQAAD